MIAESGDTGPAGTTTRRVVIEGRVQGVGFRAWTAREARSRGLVGWVRNRRDGSVEAVFGGEPDAVASMVAVCRQGPGGAAVTSIREDDAPDPTLDLDRFEQRPTD